MRKHFIVGTAGHVDHGKSSLIRALTGIETDRLPEEKARGLSIDLGFAHLALPGDVWAGIVDVPGHERFLKNMLAGVGGFDVALLVVDAQEGVMPQTREHVEILELLRTPHGLVAVTKADLVDDDFLQLVSEDLSEFLQGTFLATARVLPVSSKTGKGLPELKLELARLLGSSTVRDRRARVRLPIDRAFVRPGFGSVVTGSLWSGTLRKGDHLSLLPADRDVRVRGLQVHGQEVEEAVAGQRVAVNLSNVDLEDVKRGMVLASPAWLSPTTRLDVRLALPKRVPRPLKHRSRVRVYHATTEVFARAILLEGDEVAPGGRALAQLVCDEPITVVAGDRLVLRDFTSSYTLAGAEVLEPLASPHRRKDDSVLQELERKESGDLAQRILAELTGWTSKTTAQLAAQLQMSVPELTAALEQMDCAGAVARLPKGWAARSAVEETSDALLGLVGGLQQKSPWKSGWRKEELLKQLNHSAPRWAEEVLTTLVAQGQLAEKTRLLSLPGHQPALTVAQQQTANRVLQRLRVDEFSPAAWDEVPTLESLEPAAWRPVETYLQETGAVVKVAPGLFYARDTLEEAQRRLGELPAPFTAAQARDALKTTRKYIIPLLEYFDANGFTLRQGEVRTVRAQPAPAT